MSYTQWSNFAYYNTGDRVLYQNNTYEALQANVNVVPLTVAPNWLLIPDPTGADVSSLSGLRNDILIAGGIREDVSTIGFATNGQEIGFYTTSYLQTGSFSNSSVPNPSNVRINLTGFPNADYDVVVNSINAGFGSGIYFTVYDKTQTGFSVQWFALNTITNFAVSFDWVAVGVNPLSI